MHRFFGILLFIAAALLLPAFAFAAALDTDNDGVPDVFPASSISAGSYHVCALGSGAVQCWGDSFSGMNVAPTLVNPVSVSTGESYGCALDDNGVYCWGWGGNGETQVPALSHPIAVSAADTYACAIDDSGVHCWGLIFGNEPIPALSHPVVVSAGEDHRCAIDDSGLHCWGDNYADKATPPPLINPVAVSAGLWNTCALDNGGVHCWGAADYGQTTVPPLTNPVAVSLGNYHVCALDDNGVHCWGDNTYGQTTVPSLVNPVAVSASSDYSCALDDNGVHCWGVFDNEVPLPSLLGDNCPLLANADQLNTDGDSEGNACDDDDDNDGTPDVSDAMPLDRWEIYDTDGDGLGNNGDQFPNDANILNEIRGINKADKVGAVVSLAGDVNLDGFSDFVIGIPGYDVPATQDKKMIKNAGRVIVVSGRAWNDWLVTIDGTEENEALGFSVAGNNDVDNNGVSDILFGAPGADDAANQLQDAGSVTLLHGTNVYWITTFYGTAAHSQFGYAVAMGDVIKGDKKADIIIGAPTAPDVAAGFKRAGSVTVISGSDMAVSSVQYGADKSLFGASLAVGNVPAVGGASVIIGIPGANDDANKLKRAGAVQVSYFVGNATTSLIRYGAVTNARLGTSVAAGDVGKNGYDDVLAGAPRESNGKLKAAGSVSVYSGADFEPLPLAKKYGVTARSGMGNSVAAGDINGDGYADIIAGAAKDDNPDTKVIKDAGSVSIWSGNGYSQIGSTLYGTVAKDYFGSSVSAGDINMDGKADLIVGIPGKEFSSLKSNKDVGAVKVLSGVKL